MSISTALTQQEQTRLNRSRGAMIGLAVGDAVGTTLEFLPRGSFKPITDMVGGGHFCLKKGYWTDDTSMALCLGYSLLECQGFDPSDQMTRYCHWLENGYMSSIGRCFDVGMTVVSALRRFQKHGDPFAGSKAKMSSGNGSIMRLAPIPIYYQFDFDQAIHYAGESSRTTHASSLCIDACRYLADILVGFICGEDKSYIVRTRYVPKTNAIATLRAGEFLNKSYGELIGNGYVVRSLEASLWCFYHHEQFDQCVLAAANLGDDADTTAAVTGQLAGAFYGYDAIRPDWRDALHWQHEIADLAFHLFEPTLYRGK